MKNKQTVWIDEDGNLCRMATAGECIWLGVGVAVTSLVAVGLMFWMGGVFS